MLVWGANPAVSAPHQHDNWLSEADAQGTGFLYLNGYGNRGIDEDWVASGSGRLCRTSPPPMVSHMDLVGALDDPQRAGALCCWNINLAQSNPRQAALRRAMSREDLFVLAVDLFATDTTDLADIVLPAASFLEFDDIVASYFHRSLSVQRKAMDPLGESLPNTEVFRRLAAAMGYDDPDLFATDRELIDEVLRRTGCGLDFDELVRRGTIWPSATTSFFATRRVSSRCSLRSTMGCRWASPASRRADGRGGRAPARTSTCSTPDTPRTWGEAAPSTGFWSRSWPRRRTHSLRAI